MNTHSVTYEKEFDYVLIEYFGSVNMHEIEKVRTQAIALTKHYKCYKLLTDFRHGSFELSTLEVYELPESTEKAYEEAGLKIASIKRALVTGTNSSSVLFLETASVNQGHDVKIFHDIETARTWLQNE